jgi:hypothetical protein
MLRAAAPEHDREEARDHQHEQAARSGEDAPILDESPLVRVRGGACRSVASRRHR